MEVEILQVRQALEPVRRGGLGLEQVENGKGQGDDQGAEGDFVERDVQYEPDCFMMFGPESRGIPEEILVKYPDTCVRIPMWGDIRSLNLSNSVAIMLYEGLRQNGFEKMTMEGQLHTLEW